MTTLPPPGIRHFPPDSLESKIYGLVENFKEFIPVANDRYRLAFNLFKYLKGAGDPPEISIRNAKIQISGISGKDLAFRIGQEIELLRQG